MKTYLIVLNFFLAVFVNAQSTFEFRNGNSFAGIDAPLHDSEGNRLSGAIYAAELWGGITSNSLSPTYDFDNGGRVIVSFGTGLAAGYFSSTRQMTVVNSAPGGFAWVQVRAWDTRLGATWEEVAALGMGGYGESSLLYLVGGNPLGGPPTTPNPLIGLQSFSLRPIPEPSVWQLSLVSLVTLLWFRRKAQRTKSR